MYSLDSGKKVRPIIVKSVYKKLGNTNDLPHYVMQAAIAIEYIHTASLIIDDIMDDDDVTSGI